METKILHNMINILTLMMLVFVVSLSEAKTSKHSLKHLRLDLMHIDSKENFSRSELLQRMTSRSHQRMIHLARKTNNLSRLDSKQATGAQTDAYLGSGEFVMDIAIGTPSKSFPAIIDTGSDLSSLNLEKHSPMFFGSLAHLKASAAAGPTQTTPLVKNPIYPSFYYLSLLGVTVGSTKLNIPSSTFALNMSDGTGGMIIDSGTTFTYLEAAAYNAAKKAFISQMKLPVADGSNIGFDVCFKPPKNASFDLPKFILHFDGADLDLPESNYIFHDADTSLLCLTITASAGISILGNMQQQNFFIKYDLGKNKLSFIPTQCDKL